MKPMNCGNHADYQRFVSENLRKYYPNPDVLPRATWDVIERFWALDLSYTDEHLCHKYSKFGPVPRTPSCMQRSYLLSICFKVTSITDWVAQLKSNHLFAILSGFEVGNTPGVGTFYDFFRRLWNSKDSHLSPHIHPVKTKVQKPKCKGAKADPVGKMTVAQLLPELELTTFSIEKQPYHSLLHIYKKQFLDMSISKGLINKNSLSVAGDGTPVVTSHRMRSRRICPCFESNISPCTCGKYFSQPDCDIEWDSSRDRWYHGYDLYMFVASDSESDLPIFPFLNPASKHDSHCFLEAFFSMKSFLYDLHVSRLLLDSAHDAIPIFAYCKRENITPFIDLNEKRGVKVKYKHDFTIGKDGVPVCKEGFHMNHDGCECSKYRLKFRCPLVNRKHGCFCERPYSDSKYDRTVHLAMKDNPRLFNIPPRDSKEWKREYRTRTAVERSNKRQKLDFKLEDGRHRSTKMWCCRLYHIMML